MRPPLEYGDNFPVPTGCWNPAEPWRFPKHEVLSPRPGFWGYVLPWITLGVGVTLGVLWMSWHLDLNLMDVKPKVDDLSVQSSEARQGVLQVVPGPKAIHIRTRSRLA